MSNDLRQVRVMLEALLRQNDQLGWCDSWAFGANSGGENPYVSLFHSRLEYRVAHCYHEDFKRLPDFIRNELPQDGDFGGNISTKRQEVEANGRLRPCTPFQFVCFRQGSDDKASVKFYGVTFVLQNRQPPRQESPVAAQRAPVAEQPITAKPRPKWENRGDAIQWGVSTGVIGAEEMTGMFYDALKEQVKPTKAAEMFDAWEYMVTRMQAIAQRQRPKTPAELEKRWNEFTRNMAQQQPAEDEIPF